VDNLTAQIQYINPPEMSEMIDHIDQAKLWFIMRYVPGGPGQGLCLRLNGLVTGQVPQQRAIQRHKRYNFTFVMQGDDLLVVPLSPEAGWASGTITFIVDHFQYCSNPTPSDYLIG